MQKQLALAEIQRRNKPNVDFRVFVDPITDLGSGGSTVNALKKLNDDGGIDGSVLIIHSGGRASRLDQFSIIGKLFVPLPCADCPTAFDMIIDNFSNVPDGNVIITPCDQVVLGLENAVFNSSGITGVATFDDSITAGKHGVFFLDHDEQPYKVMAFYEKPIMMRWDYFWVDTGILHLAPDIVAEIVEQGVIEQSNLYKDIVPAFADRFYCYADPDVSFFHLGTHDDFVDNFIKLKEALSEGRPGNTAISVFGG